jgi:YHS domain-containing protein
MLLRSTALAGLAAGILSVVGASPVPVKARPDDKKADAAAAKKALAEVQDFVGLWKLEGTQKAGAATKAWKEGVSWGWRFKDGDAWLVAEFAGGKGKHWASGELRYDAAKKKYRLALAAADKTEQAFEGDLMKGGGLKLERADAKTKDVYRLTLNTLAEGDRFQVKLEKQDGGKGLFDTRFAMNGNKDGASFAGGGAKKPECVVSGGAAAIAVNFGGKTYYVCCSGCRDEFNASPQKYAK